MKARWVLLALVASATALAIPSGEKWPATALPVPFKIYQHPDAGPTAVNCPGCDFASQIQPAVLSGFARWTKSQVACTSWNSAFDGGFTSPSGINAINATDGQNRVIWLGGTDWTLAQAILGLTTTSYDPGTGQLLDADMQFNNNQTWKIGGSAQTVDVESIATHEAGHFLGLAHTPNVAAIMYATYTVGAIKRTLDPGTDVQDVCTVYPNTTGGGSQGDLCQMDSNCGTAAPICRGPAGGGLICTKTCAVNGDCPTGYTCQTSNNGLACLVPPGSSDLCKFCTNGTQCSNGLCVSDGPHMWCSATCTSAATCGTGFQCVAAGQFSVCVPNNAACPTAQCQTAADCPVGYACNLSKMCEATGGPGDRCEVNAYCQGCLECVGTTTQAYCLTCCGGADGGGGICGACPNGACPSSQACEAINGSTDQVCVPAGIAACAACPGGGGCESGLTCNGNLCHAACNTANPGNCPTCIDLGGGVGVCACGGETSVEGQSCGTDGFGNFHVCQGGYVCVGSPAVCRAPCTQGKCGGNDICQSVSNQQVCVPNSTPGGQCASCTGSSCTGGLTCFHGRCYTTCSLGSPQCVGCVNAGGTGICACDDEFSSAGGPCGILGTGQPAACPAGQSCMVDQLCHVNCSLANPQCPAGQTCMNVSGGTVCSSGAINPPPDAGPGGGGGNNNAGCGCGAPGGLSFCLLALAALAARRARRIH